ncbi:MAG: agmatinase [Vampirovibrionales bacterium]|nr:agmatinase [Vampirovibrionales bacterium]
MKASTVMMPYLLQHSPLNTLQRLAQKPQWMGSVDDWDAAKWVAVGIPYDGTCSYRPGTRFGPEMIRNASWGMETYSPALNGDMEAACLWDAGELALPFGNRNAALALMHEATQAVLAADKHWLGIGGEHLVTLPTIQAYTQKYPDLVILHADAHTDLRDDYLGEKLSHATVLRRCAELLQAPSDLLQFGIRSGLEEEWNWMRANHTYQAPDADWASVIKQRAGNRPVFVTLDLDVFDPAVLPGTGTPEPGGWLWADYLRWINAMRGLNIVGMDVVELSPMLDASGCSTALAAKAIRELLIVANL